MAVPTLQASQWTVTHSSDAPGSSGSFLERDQAQCEGQEFGPVVAELCLVAMEILLLSISKHNAKLTPGGD